MSGGSYDYFCFKLDDFADEIRRLALERFVPPEHRVARLLFAQHMQAAAKAAHDIEWVDSSDYGPGDELEALNAYFALHGNPKIHAQQTLAQQLREFADMLDGQAAQP